MLSAVQERLPFTFDRVKAVKETIWGPVSAVKSVFGSASNIATSLREKRNKTQEESQKQPAKEKDVSQDSDAVEMQDMPRQTTIDRSVTSTSDNERERIRQIMSTMPKPEGMRELILPKLHHSSPTPSMSPGLPARPPVKKRNYWMFVAIFLLVVLISSVTPIAVLLHHAHRGCEAHTPSPTPATITTRNVSTATERATETALSWKTYTHISIVTSTYTCVPPPATTGLDAGASAVVVPVTPKTSETRKDVVRRFEDWQPPATVN